jgi:hypothetical protein
MVATGVVAVIGNLNSGVSIQPHRYTPTQKIARLAISTN